ncbi:MAG: hypothetical protein ACREN7_00035 [Candidatus Dormibacteria bacterium]
MVTTRIDPQATARAIVGAMSDDFVSLYELALVVKDSARCTFEEAATAIRAECEPKLGGGWRRKGTLAELVASYRQDLAAQGLGERTTDRLVLERWEAELRHLAMASW